MREDELVEPRSGSMLPDAPLPRGSSANLSVAGFLRFSLTAVAISPCVGPPDHRRPRPAPGLFSRYHRARPQVHLLLSGRSLYVSDWMNFPGGGSPVTSPTRIGVFSSICVLRVEGQPTTHLDPLVSKLLAQGFRCPIGSAGPHDRSQARRHLQHTPLRQCI